MRHSLLVAALLLASSSPAAATTVQGFVGIERLNWKFDASPNGEPIYQFSDAAEPFTLRLLELKVRGLAGVDLGFNYLTSKLFGAAGFAPQGGFADKTSPIASIFGAYLRVPLAPGFGAEVRSQVRRFELSRTFVGRFTGSGPFTYLPDGGAPEPILEGATTHWSTRSTDFQAGFSLDYVGLVTEERTDHFVYLGWHRFAYDAPVLVDVTSNADGVQTFEALMGSTMTANLMDLSIGFSPGARADEAPFGIGGHLSSQIGKMGIKNDYLDASGGVSIGLGAEVVAEYAFLAGPVSGALRGGLVWSWFSSSVTADTTARKEIAYYDILGDPAVYPTGVDSHVSVDREEVFWGPYVSLALTYNPAISAATD